MDGDIRKGIDINMASINMYSTSVTEIQQHLIHIKYTDLMISVPINMKHLKILPTFPLFQNINYLVIYCER
jgi:hypothetical protein